MIHNSKDKRRYQYLMKKLYRKDTDPLTENELDELLIWELKHPENWEKDAKMLAEELGIDPNEFVKLLFSGMPLDSLFKPLLVKGMFKRL